MRIVCCLLATLAATLPLSAQSWDRTHDKADLLRFLQQSFRGQHAAGTGPAYRAAARAGWFRTPATRRLFKRQLRQLAREHQARGRAVGLRHPVAAPDAVQQRLVAATPESEYNDSEGYATNLGTLITTATGTGTLTNSDDKDTFRFETLLDGTVTFRTTHNSTETPSLMLTNADGDESWSYHDYDSDLVSLQLPKGVYHVSIGAGSSAATTYSLALDIQFTTIGTLRFGTTTRARFGTNSPVCFRAVLPQDGRLGIKLTNAASVDGLLLIQNDKWGYVYDVDEASTASNGEGGLDALLPKGTYYIYLFADATVTESVTTTFSAQAIPTLAAAATGTLAGASESMDLFRFVLPAAAFVDLRIVGNGASPSTDTYLALYDRNMVQILEGDDDPGGTDSVIGATLPAGTYYAASNAFYDAGGYRITRATSAPATVTARAGTNPGPIARFASRALKFTLLTPSWVEIDVDEGSLDAQFGVLDWKTGLALAWEDDENLGSSVCTMGMHLPAGEYLILVKDYESLSGTVDVRILPPLQRGANDNVQVLGHAGDPLFFVVGTRQTAPNNPFGGVITGNLLIDLPSAVVLPLVMPSTGRIDFRTSLPPGSGVLLQMVAVDTVTARGAFSNLLK